MKAVALLSLLMLVALAGCGSPPAKTPPTDGEGRYVIEMTSGNQFNPSSAQVPVGSTVVWVHQGGAPHDVHAKDGSFSSGGTGGMQEGDEFPFTFEEAGTYVYECRLHAGSGMKGKLVVE